MAGWGPLPTGLGATPMLKELRAMNAQIHGTIFASFGQIGNLTVTGDVTVGDAAGIFTRLSGATGVIQFDDQTSASGPDNAAYIVPGAVDEGDVGGGNHAWRADLLFYGMEWTAGGDLPWQRMTSVNQYHPGTGFIQWGFGASSNVWLDLDESGIITSKKDHYFDGGILATAAGTATLPSLAWGDGSGNYDTGVYLTTTDSIGLTIAGTRKLSVAFDYLRGGDGSTTGYGAFRVGGTGSNSLPTYSWIGDTSTGIFRGGSGQIGFASLGTRKATIANNLLLEGGANLRVDNPATTGDAADAAWVGVGGAVKELRWNTSARRFKRKISYDWQSYLAGMELRPAYFYRPDDGKWFFDFIAEDLAEQDGTFGKYDDDGLIMNYQKPAVLAILAAKVNALEAQVKELQSGIHK